MDGGSFLDRLDLTGASGRFTVSMADSHGDFLVRNAMAVRIEQDLGDPERRFGSGRRLRYVCWFSYPAGFGLIDDGSLLLGQAQEAVDRWLRPWLRADEPRVASFHLFPRAEATFEVLASIWDRVAHPRWRGRG